MQLVQNEPSRQPLQGQSLLPTRRDVVARIFRQRTRFIITFLLVLIGFAVSGQFKPRYRAEMRLLVRKERVDPIVTTNQDSVPQLQTLGVREEDVNTAVQLLRSDDLLRRVSIKSHLVPLDQSTSKSSAVLVRKLSGDLDISAIPKTDLIAVNYFSPSPEQSRLVLTNLAALYLEEQRDVGARDSRVPFFESQVKRQASALQAAEAQLLSFTQRTGVVSANLERELTVRRLQDLDTARIDNKALIADARGRNRQIAAQLSTQAPRIATDQREADNPQLITQIKGKLLDLQLRRIELLNKYDPQYRLVTDVEREIATAQAQLDAQLAAPVRENTTSIDPTYVALQSDQAKVRAELAGLRAKSTQLTRSSKAVHSSAKKLASQDVEQEALLRDVANEKTQYDLYVGKLEQARVTSDLDKNGILNIAVVQEPATPLLPQSSVLSTLLTAMIVATILSLGVAMFTDLFDPTVRSAPELAAILHVPTLAQFSPMKDLKRSTL